jgi:hypothetical protein
MFINIGLHRMTRTTRQPKGWEAETNGKKRQSGKPE